MECYCAAGHILFLLKLFLIWEQENHIFSSAFLLMTARPDSPDLAELHCGRIENRLM